MNNIVPDGILTASQIEKRFQVYPETGKIDRINWKSSKPVGYIKTGDQSNGGGYRMVNFRPDGENGKLYNIRVHRLIWMWVYGEWPNGEIDHINGDRSDNRIANLRLSTSSQNKVNRPKQVNNKSGFKWVYKCCQTGNYRAEVSYTENGVKKKFRSSGHKTPDEAYEVASNFARSAHGKFYNPGKQK